jgi:hypothetical protein
MYLNDSKGRLPWVNPIPSLQPPLDGKSVTELLKAYTKDVSIGWKCPSDSIRRRINGTPEGFDTYFEREGISYLYNRSSRSATPASSSTTRGFTATSSRTACRFFGNSSRSTAAKTHWGR